MRRLVIASCRTCRISDIGREWPREWTNGSAFERPAHRVQVFVICYLPGPPLTLIYLSFVNTHNLLECWLYALYIIYSLTGGTPSQQELVGRERQASEPDDLHVGAYPKMISAAPNQAKEEADETNPTQLRHGYGTRGNVLRPQFMMGTDIAAILLPTIILRIFFFQIKTKILYNLRRPTRIYRCFFMNYINYTMNHLWLIHLLLLRLLLKRNLYCPFNFWIHVSW